MATARSVETTDETQIRELIEGWTKAIRTKDVGKLMSYIAPDILLFDLAPPLQYSGA